MKKHYIFILFVIGFMYSLQSQTTKTCTTKVNLPIIDVFPITDPVAISTRGYTYDNNNSIEFDSASLYNNWIIPLSYSHVNAHTFFTSDTNYWKLDNGLFEIILDSVPNGGYNYTTSILRNTDINSHYGYYETKLKMPKDPALCTSFWGFEGSNAAGNYREIDAVEYFTDWFQSNIYHHLGPMYGGMFYVDTSMIDSAQWYIYGFEWLPKEYNLYINHHLVGSFNYEDDCVEQYLDNMSIWMLWLVNWRDRATTGPFPKVLKSDYIRIYSLDTTTINTDFYDNLSNFDYNVWKTIHLGDSYSSDAKFNDNNCHAIRSTDGYTFGEGFEVSLGTGFETINYKK